MLTKTCKQCGKEYREGDEIDPCFGEPLPGVNFACCGHGNTERAYISFDNGVIVRGFDIVEQFGSWKQLNCKEDTNANRGREQETQ